MHVAHLEKRNCYLFCYSSDNEIVKLELNLDHGWQTILEFLSVSFNGGTDINNLLLKVLDKTNEYRWKKADIILLSDGHFKVEDKLIDGEFKLNTFRIFGVQLVKWSTQSLSAICHIVLNLSDV